MPRNRSRSPEESINLNRPHRSCHLVGLLLTTLGFFSCGKTGREAAAPASSPLVEAVAARLGALPVEEVVSGVVRARNQVSIRPEVGGRIVEVMVRSGDAVKLGQRLVRIDAVEATERLRQAEADVRLAEASAAAANARVVELEARVARIRTLAGEELVSAQELETLEAQLDALRASTDEALARVEQARATVEERRSELAKTVVRSPVAGRLGERRVEVGMLVDTSDVLFVAGDLDELIVEVDLTEAMLAKVQEGLPVEIEGRTSGSETIRAQLSRISPFLAAESFTTIGEIDVDNRGQELKPGMFVTVRILIGQSQTATLVPVSAIWEDPASGVRGAFVVGETAGLGVSPTAAADNVDRDRPVSFRSVEILAEGRGAAGVRGVEEGEWVVTVGQHLLRAELDSAAASSAAGEANALLSGTAMARVRPVSWDHVQELQDLQNEDLLEGFLDKQRIVAAALGAEIPESEDVVEQVLAEAAANDQENRQR